MEIIEFIFHLEKHLEAIIGLFGPWTYVILFLIVFAETGFVIAPFLPGDSLLFIVGTLSGSGFLNIWIIYFSLLIAAILGDSVNYWIGNKLGPKVFSKENSRLFNKKYLEKTRLFYEKHGGKTIVIARFVPIIRTFAPFVAGIGKMNYPSFLFFNVFGAFIWITSLTFAGYFFGSLSIVKDNFEIAIFGIILVSLTPIFYEYIKHRFQRRAAEKLEKATYSEIQETFEKEHLK